MDQQDIQLVTQYVTARTSYSWDIVEDIVKTGLEELTALSQTSSQTFDRQHVLEYVCQWTIRRTKHPETMIREILECAGRCLDDLCRIMDKKNSEEVSQSEHH
ncbi:MAG: hypothetical protein O2999_09840 [Nitrospirae bacterium]|nr:hypothetical protein [Nitrospirota bacterium]MDA1304583.1 hypothetical protein [Nitrospirota bacterium]